MRRGILNEEYGYVESGYIGRKLGINCETILKLKLAGILESYCDKNGPIQGFYTADSFLKVKKFIEDYKKQYGIKATFSIIERELRNKKGS